MQSLIEHKLIGDFRAPNLMRFGFNALFLDESDVLQAVKIINRVFNHKLWKKYNKLVIGSAILLVIGVASIKGWQAYDLNRNINEINPKTIKNLPSDIEFNFSRDSSILF